MMKRKNRCLVACLTAGLGLCSLQASASPVLIVNLDATSFVGAPGTAGVFAGTILNMTGVEVFLNGAGGSLSSPELTLDLTDFFTLTPLSLLDGESYIGDIFAVAISNVALPGDYFGTFTIQGGEDALSFDDVGSADFQVQVSEVAEVPEPSTGMLSGFGGVMLVAWRWFKLSRTLQAMRATTMRHQ